MDFTSLTFTDVSRHFGRRRALARVSFSAEAGQVVALLGANGSGKSTLLSIAATLLDASSGTVRYGGVTGREGGHLLRGRIGVLGHDLYIYPELSAAENLRSSWSSTGCRTRGTSARSCGRPNHSASTGSWCRSTIRSA